MSQELGPLPAGEGERVREARRPRLLAWYAGSGGREDAGGPGSGWSLLAGNGREFARSASTYGTEKELGSALRELWADRRALRYQLVKSGGRYWSWTAYLPSRRSGVRDGELIAVSARTYLRQDQCRAGMAGFPDALERVRRSDWDALLKGPRQR